MLADRIFLLSKAILIFATHPTFVSFVRCSLLTPKSPIKMVGKSEKMWKVENLFLKIFERELFLNEFLTNENFLSLKIFH